MAYPKKNQQHLKPIITPQRTVIEWVEPCLDKGKYPIKKIPHEKIELRSKIYADGFFGLRAKILFQKIGENTWHEKEIYAQNEDIWTGVFSVSQTGTYQYCVKAWTDEFLTWQERLKMRQHFSIANLQDLLAGEKIIRKALQKAKNSDKLRLELVLKSLRDLDFHKALAVAVSKELKELIRPYPDDQHATFSEKLPLWIERPKALFSAWYEFFPRSTSRIEGKHGSFSESEYLLPRIAYMGFDTIYLPPIHPIGTSFRKGKNNSAVAQADDVGSCWAIGSKDGGHKSVHKQLGTVHDFEKFVRKAKQHGLEVALDLAFHCSPDHPYIEQFPQWFARNADASLVYAENPPHEYKDIVFFDFQNPDYENLWKELLSIVLFWAEKGVRVFRVDNPHTKPFLFWEWLIAEARSHFADLIFLAEAFTRPSLMYQLSKIGFTQSYTYFAWRNTKTELISYMNELINSPLKDYFRPNLWTNTPDVLSKYLQFGGENAFAIRLVLAATLSASYGIYGPTFEFAWTHGSFGGEEYHHSEKYEIRHWDWNYHNRLQSLIRQINEIRKKNTALQKNTFLRFQNTDNEQLIAYLRIDFEKKNRLLIVVNLDSKQLQKGHIFVNLQEANLPQNTAYSVKDLLTKQVYSWQNEKNYVELSPEMPFHIFEF